MARKSEFSSFIDSTGQEASWVDADTLNTPEGPVRIEGIDAHEIPGVYDGVFKQGEKGGLETTRVAQKMQEAMGANIITRTGEQGVYGRDIGRLSNEQGEDYSEMMVATGAIRPSKYTGEREMTALNANRNIRELTGQEHKYQDVFTEIEDSQSLYEQYLPEPIMKGEAFNEREYDPAIHSGVANRDYGRNFDNTSRNVMADSWDGGWRNFTIGIAAFSERLGESTGQDWMREWGLRKKLEEVDDGYEAPEIPTDIRDIHGTMDAALYALATGISSIPYTALGVTGALLSPVTGGWSGIAAFTALAATSAGDAIMEMGGDTTDGQFFAAIGIGMGVATLERIGIAGFFSPADVLTASGRNRMIKHMAKDAMKLDSALTQRQAIDQAKTTFGKASRDSISAGFRRVAGLSAQDVVKMGVIREASKGLAKGTVSEMTTEASQEALQMLGVNLATGKEYEIDEAKWRLINAGVGGGTVGGGLGTAGGLIRANKRKNIIKGLDRATEDGQGQLDVLRKQDIERGENPQTTEQILNETRAKRKSPQAAAGASASARAQLHAEHNRGGGNVRKNAGKSVGATFSTVWQGIVRFGKAAASTGISNELAVRSKSLRKLRSLVSDTITGGTYHGGQPEHAWRARLISKFEGLVDTQRIVGKKWKSAKGRQEYSDDMKEFYDSGSYAMYEAYRAGNGNLNQGIVPKRLQGRQEELFDAITELKTGYKTLFETMQDAHSRESREQILGEDKDRFDGPFNFSMPDKDKVKADQGGFKKWLRNSANSSLTDADIDRYYREIINDEGNITDESLINYGGAWRPWVSHELGFHGKPGWDKYSSTDVFANYDRMARKAAKYTSNTKYWGEGGKNVDYLLNAAGQEGVEEADLNRIAWHVKSIIDSSNGNYNRIKSPNMALLSKMATAWSAFVGLGLSALSSIPETAMIFENVRNTQEGRQAIMHLTKEFIQLFKNGASAVQGKYYTGGKGQELLDKSGLPKSLTTVHRRLGIGSTTPLMDKWLNGFFNITGISAITSWQRRANASFAVDYTINRMNILSSIPISDNGKMDMTQASRDQQEMYNDLTAMGADVDKLSRIWNRPDVNQDLFDMTNDQRAMVFHATGQQVPVDQKQLLSDIDEQMQTIIYSFVNQRVQNPDAHNRPLLFQDPQLYMFFQFNGFISTFTASAIPRLVHSRIRRGAPEVKVNTIALVIAMIALGGASQFLKDFFKYGEDAKFLNNWQKLQRAIYSSGILGQGERVVDAAIPLYGRKGSNPFAKTWNTLIGEVGPSVGLGGNIIGAVTQAGLGDTRGAANSLLKTVPGPSVLPGGKDWYGRENILNSLGIR